MDQQGRGRAGRETRIVGRSYLKSGIINASMRARIQRSWVLIIALVVVALAGLVLLFGRQYLGYGGLAYELIAYGISVIALVLAVLSVLNSVRQGRIMRRMVRDVHHAVAELEDVSQTSAKIQRQLGKDYRMNQAIAEVLAEHGVGENEKVRQKIARKVARRLKKRSK